METGGGVKHKGVELCLKAWVSEEELRVSLPHPHRGNTDGQAGVSRTGGEHAFQEAGPASQAVVMRSLRRLRGWGGTETL